MKFYYVSIARSDRGKYHITHQTPLCKAKAKQRQTNLQKASLPLSDTIEKFTGIYYGWRCERCLEAAYKLVSK